MEREQLSWQERGQLWLRLIIRLVLAAAAVVLVAKLGPPLLSLFAPFVAALIVAALLNPAGALAPAQAGWSRKLLSLAAGGGHLRSDRRLSGHPDLCRGQRTGLPGAELERDADPGGGLFRSDGGPVCPGDGPAAPVGGGDGGGHRQRPSSSASRRWNPHRPC